VSTCIAWAAIWGCFLAAVGVFVGYFIGQRQ